MKETKNALITIRLKTELKEQIKAYCDKVGITQTDFVLNAITEYAKKREVI